MVFDSDRGVLVASSVSIPFTSNKPRGLRPPADGIGDRRGRSTEGRPRHRPLRRNLGALHKGAQVANFPNPSRQGLCLPGGPPTTWTHGNRKTITISTLFGAFIADFEHEMAPGEERPTTVTFMPTVFAKDISLPKIELGPDQYIPKDIPSGMEFKPEIVSTGGNDREFRLTQRETIDSVNSIVWTWIAKAHEGFAGSEFKIAMKASETQRPKEDLTVARLPITIERKRDDAKGSWYERLGNGFIDQIPGIVIGVIVAFGGWNFKVIVSWLRRRRSIGFR